MIPQMIPNGQIADNVVQMKDVDIGMLETLKERYFQLFQQGLLQLSTTWCPTSTTAAFHLSSS